MTAALSRLRTGLVLPVLFVFVTVTSFTALGTWQIERKAWKEALITKLDGRLAAKPAPLPPRELWSKLNPADDEFRRVSFSAAFVPGAEAFVYTVASPLQSEQPRAGYWLFALARLRAGELVAVNRGFMPEDRKGLELARVGDTREMVGVMRWPEPHGYFTPKDDPVHNLWFVRDHLAIAADKGWQAQGEELAPFFVDLERPAAAPSGWPRPVPPGINVRNAHLQYAITWYALAVVVSTMFVVWLRTRRQAG